MISGLFAIIFFISILGLIISIIKPSAFEVYMKSVPAKKDLILGFVVLMIFSVYMVNKFSSPTENKEQAPAQQNEQTVSQSTNETKKIEEVKTSEENKILREKNEIKQIVEKELQGQNNNKKPYLRKIDIVEQSAGDGGWGVFVEYNADDNFTPKSVRQGIDIKMADIYKGLYTSGKDIEVASVSAFFPMQDKYGNQSDDVIYKSILRKSDAQKVNWQADKATLELGILPSVWGIVILNSSLK